MAMRSICPQMVLPDPKADYQTAKRVEQYRIGRQAIYFKAFPGDKYLPFAAIERAWTQKSSVPLTGCCGKELPVVVLRIQYGGGFYQHFTFEKQEKADQALKAIGEAKPEALQPPEKQ